MLRIGGICATKIGGLRYRLQEAMPELIPHRLVPFSECSEINLHAGQEEHTNTKL